MKNKLFQLIFATTICISFTQCNFAQTNIENLKTNKEKNMEEKNPFYKPNDTAKVTLNDADLKKILPAEVFEVARKKGTE